LARQRERSHRLRAAAARVLDTELPADEDLWYPEERTDVTEWLREHGWDASAIAMGEMLARYGRTVPGDDILPPTVFVSAQRL
jgi:O-methyltransferase involved in polyketide biosynthesis